MTARSKDVAALARQLAELLAQAANPDNEDESIDEDALRELAKRDAEQMKRARNR